MNAPAEFVRAPVTRVRIGVATHVTPKSSLSATESLEACVNSGELKVIVDLSAAQKIDSLGISALMDTQDRLLQKGGWLKVTGHNSIIAEIAGIPGIGRLFSNRQKTISNTETIVLITPTVVQSAAVDEATHNKIQRFEQDQSETMEILDQEMELFFGSSKSHK